MTMKNNLKYQKDTMPWSYGIDGGRYCICHFALFITHGAKTDEHERARFWGSLLQNSVFFLLVVNAAMFFICATTLAWGGWTTEFSEEYQKQFQLCSCYRCYLRLLSFY